MRFALIALVLGGCLAGQLDGNARPSVMPMLSELPTEPEKRNAILDQSTQTPGPEQRKGMTKRQKKAETFAALAAAMIGQAFSKTQNVTLGTATTVDENKLGPKAHPQRPRGDRDKDGSAESETPGAPVMTDEPGASDLVPWIKLQKSKPADIDSVR